MVLLCPIIKRRLRGGSTLYLATVRASHPAAESLVLVLTRLLMFGFSFYLKDIVEIARPHMKYYVYAVMYTLCSLLQ